ncbi:hypothetical protein [Klebsiella pneumoniae]
MSLIYQIDGQKIQIKNQVSADNYEKYNEIHGTLYLPEPKLGTGKQNETVEYLAEIQKIRQHNAKERELEQRQRYFDQQHEYYYSCSNEPFSSPEVATGRRTRRLPSSVSISAIAASRVPKSHSSGNASTRALTRSASGW